MLSASSRSVRKFLSCSFAYSKGHEAGISGRLNAVKSGPHVVCPGRRRPTVADRPARTASQPGAGSAEWWMPRRRMVGQATRLPGEPTMTVGPIRRLGVPGEAGYVASGAT